MRKLNPKVKKRCVKVSKHVETEIWFHPPGSEAQEGRVLQCPSLGACPFVLTVDLDCQHNSSVADGGKETGGKDDFLIFTRSPFRLEVGLPLFFSWCPTISNDESPCPSILKKKQSFPWFYTVVSNKSFLSTWPIVTQFVPKHSLSGGFIIGKSQKHCQKPWVSLNFPNKQQVARLFQS